MSLFLVGFALVLARLSGMLITSPLFALKGLPMLWKAATVIALGLLVYPMIPLPLSWPPGLLMATLWELGVGMLLGFLLSLAGGVALAAGGILDLQVGLANVVLLDPAHGESHPLLATLYQTMLMLGFLAMDGHHLVLRLVLRSFQWVPLGGGGTPAPLVHLLSGACGLFFPLLLGLALPVMSALLAFELLLAFVSRVAPQANMLLAGASAKLLVAWIFILVSLPCTLEGLDQLWVQVGLA